MFLDVLGFSRIFQDFLGFFRIFLLGGLCPPRTSPFQGSFLVKGGPKGGGAPLEKKFALPTFCLSYPPPRGTLDGKPPLPPSGNKKTFRTPPFDDSTHRVGKRRSNLTKLFVFFARGFPPPWQPPFEGEFPFRKGGGDFQRCGEPMGKTCRKSVVSFGLVFLFLV